MQRKQSTDIKVFITSRDSSCDECSEDLGRRAWITLAGDKGALCLTCADLDHLIFLPSGDAALTRRAVLDREYVKRFALSVRKLFPQCPPGREVVIAEHACLKYSGRIGRSEAAKVLDENAIRLAVIAHIRHEETQYDHLLAGGHERWESRAQVQVGVDQILTQWQAQK